MRITITSQAKTVHVPRLYASSHPVIQYCNDTSEVDLTHTDWPDPRSQWSLHHRPGISFAYIHIYIYIYIYMRIVHTMMEGIVV
jgi:hypothetical protein